MSCTIVCPAAKRSREAQTSLDQRCQMEAGIARAHGQSHAFLAMVGKRQGYGAGRLGALTAASPAGSVGMEDGPPHETKAQEVVARFEMHTAPPTDVGRY